MCQTTERGESAVAAERTHLIHILTHAGVRPSLLTGFALSDDNAHGPNEKLHLPTWRKGIEAVIRFLDEMTNA